jgi:hypothetical protein
LELLLIIASLACVVAKSDQNRSGGIIYMLPQVSHVFNTLVGPKKQNGSCHLSGNLAKTLQFDNIRLNKYGIFSITWDDLVIYNET